MAAHDIAVSNTTQLLGPLAELGWALHYSDGPDAAATVSDIGKFGDRVGTPVASRAGVLEEIIESHGADDAHARSLSARYGLDPCRSTQKSAIAQAHATTFSSDVSTQDRQRRRRCCSIGERLAFRRKSLTQDN